MSKSYVALVLVKLLVASLLVGCAEDGGQGSGASLTGDAGRSLQLCGKTFGCTAYPVGGRPSPLWWSGSFRSADGCYLSDLPSPDGEITRFSPDGTGEFMGIEATWEQVDDSIVFTTPNGSTASCHVPAEAKGPSAPSAGQAGSANAAGAGGQAGSSSGVAGSAPSAGSAGGAGKTGSSGGAGKAGSAGGGGKTGSAGGAGKAGSAGGAGKTGSAGGAGKTGSAGGAGESTGSAGSAGTG